LLALLNYLARFGRVAGFPWADDSLMTSQKRLLLIAFHFPPIQGSSGVTRTLSFAKYLRQFDWEVTVLTVKPLAYPDVRIENLNSIPPHVHVERAFALDTQRHLSIRGRYPLMLAVPDRWQSWQPHAVMRAAAIVKEWRPTVVMSTYPIATAHRIGYSISRKFQLPWVADFRDPMALDNYPPEPRLHRAFEKIERSVFTHASRVVVTTEGTARLYRARFPHFPASAMSVIPNGFDQEMFPKDILPPAATPRAADKPLQLLHSGLMYPEERNPQAFFQAVSELRQEGVLSAQAVQFNFRASGYEEVYQSQIQTLGIGDLVHLLPAIPYHRALAEMAASDAFLLFQARDCNDQIPAKLYEYLYSGRPILGLTDPIGETARTMIALGSDRIAPLDDKARIKELLPQFIEQVRAQQAPTPSRRQIMPFSREQLTHSLAKLLDGLVTRT
jgi:glycosyltransferase involved in cell wall biosynthesis